MTPQQASPRRSDDDDDDFVEASNVVATKYTNTSKSLERDGNSNNTEHDQTTINTATTLPDRDWTDNKASHPTDKHMGSSSSPTQVGNKQRNRGRTRRHYSRKQTSLLACTRWESRSSFDMNRRPITQGRKPPARSSSAKRFDKRVPGLLIASMTPFCERAASEPAVSNTTTTSSTALGGQSSLERMRSFQRKAPHEVHREMVEKLSSNDDGSTRVFRQLSFGVARLMSEEEMLQTEDGAILRGGVNKRQSLSKRGSLDVHYEKGSLKDLERMRSKNSSGTFSSHNSEQRD